MLVALCWSLVVADCHLLLQTNVSPRPFPPSSLTPCLQRPHAYPLATASASPAPVSTASAAAASDPDSALEGADKATGEGVEEEGEGEEEGADLRRDDDSSKVLECASPSIEALEAVLDRVVRSEEAAAAEAVAAVAATGSSTAAAAAEAGSSGPGGTGREGWQGGEGVAGATGTAEGTIASPKKAPQ